VRRLLLAWSARLPCRLIQEDGRPYLERYYIGTPFGWRIYLHRFVGSDPDRGLHDHPWKRAYSIVLSGWYFDERRDGLHIIRFLNKLDGDTFHRVILPRDHYLGGGLPAQAVAAMPAECWTLFVHKVGHAKPWGFLRPLDNGAAVFAPATYPDGGNRSGEWWRTAPTGAEVRASQEARKRADAYPIDKGIS